MTEKERIKRNNYMKAWERARRANPNILKNCHKCGKDFLTYKKRIRYCSVRCGRIGEQVSLSCLHCRIKFTVPKYRIKYQAKFCSVSCGSSYRKGETAGNWKGGKTDAATKLRTSKAYKLWREAVFERDKYTCVFCGDNSGGNLEADHIKPRSLFPELTLDIDNGRTLCKDCHKGTDTWGRKLFTYRKELGDIR